MRTVKIVVLFFFVTLFSCSNNSFKEHEDGFQYKFIDRSEFGLSPRVKDVVTLKVEIRTESDSLIKASDFLRIQVKPTGYEGGINQALRFMHEGDSAIFKINAGNYYQYEENKPLPRTVEHGDNLLFYVRMDDVKSMEEIKEERRLRNVSGKHRERIALKVFLKKIGIETDEIENRVYFKSTREGNGRSPHMDSHVKIHYFSYFIDGRPFNNTYENNKPFSFTIGKGQVIEGLEQGIMKMKQGGKATIVIPSSLAYGAEGLPDAGIAPFTSLVFDVELIYVEPAAK